MCILNFSRYCGTASPRGYSISHSDYESDLFPTTLPARSASDLLSFRKSGRYKMISESDAQSCPTLCDPMNCSLPGSSHEIFQAMVLECVAISFSRGSFTPRDRTRVSRIVGRHFTIWATREVSLVVKNLPTNAGDTRDTDSITGLGRSPRAGHGKPHQYTCETNPMDKRDWQSTVHGVSKS